LLDIVTSPTTEYMVNKDTVSCSFCLLQDKKQEAIITDVKTKIKRFMMVPLKDLYNC